MRSIVILIALIGVTFSSYGCMATTASWQELAEKEYQKFCNEQPDHLRCQGDSENV